MSENDETVVKVKIATVVAIACMFLSLAVSGLSYWVNTISTKQIIHGEDIATLKECMKNQITTLSDIKTVVEEVRNDQKRRERKEHGTGKLQ